MILGTIYDGIMARINNRRARQQEEKALRVLDKEEEELDNLFKSKYYSNYLQRADVQNMITSAKNIFKTNSDNLRGRATIMGATDEWVGANQKNNAMALSSLYSSLAEQGVSWKDGVLNNYLDRKANINNRRYNTLFNSANNYQNSSLNSISNIGNNIRGIDNALLNIAEGGISKKLNF
ncbi:MAG: hypothetical protein IKW05_05665 [Muribaculaceae bacterium]|nr:hypothetical protein [Muribaculaceae bacterium]